MYDPRLGFFDAGENLRAPALYAAATGEPPSRLPPAAWRSAAFAELEDHVVWTRDFVFVGVAAQTPEPGDLLPYTVGVHGVHVQREADGGLAARFNKAQHGGCRVIPAQCRTGIKTKCSFTSCGYSRDRGVIRGDELTEWASTGQQYLGLRPERLLRARLSLLGPFVAVGVDPSSAVDAPWEGLAPELGLDGFSDDSFHDLPWRSTRANWKAAARAHLARAGQTRSVPARAGAGDAIGVEASDLPSHPVWLFPNLVVHRFPDAIGFAVVQPVGLTECVQRAGAIGRSRAAADAAVGALESILAAAAAAAEADQAVLDRWRPSNSGSDVAEPREESPAGAAFQRYLTTRILAADEDDQCAAARV